MRTLLIAALVALPLGASAHHIVPKHHVGGKVVDNSGLVIIGGPPPVTFTVPARRKDIVTDPRSCVEKNGAVACGVPEEQPERATIDMDGQSTADFDKRGEKPPQCPACHERPL